MPTVKRYGDLATLAPQCFGCRKAADGTIVLAHRNRNAWGLLFGRGIKGLSLSGALLCRDCHAYGDADGRNDVDFWELAVERTQVWAWKNGFVRFSPQGGEADTALR